MKPLNKNRASMAAAALLACAGQSGTITPEETIIELLSDIGHFCDARELDFLRLLAIAVGRWKVEQVYEDWTAAELPDVTITVE
jgi:hypothetical protein